MVQQTLPIFSGMDGYAGKKTQESTSATSIHAYEYTSPYKIGHQIARSLCYDTGALGASEH